MPQKLTRDELVSTARAYEVEPAALRAVTLVESRGTGFLPSGQVIILFERHWLWKQLQISSRQIDPRRLAQQRPDLCGRNWDRRYYQGGQREWDRVAGVINWAQQNDSPRWESYKKAAYESCSWGMFQLMGFHYPTVGYADIYSMVHAFAESERLQLDAIMKWMSRGPVLTELRQKDWNRFALLYNGSGQVPVYSARLRQEYQRAKNQGW